YTPLVNSPSPLNAPRLLAFRPGQDRRLPDCLFRSSITPPAYAPVNASSTSFRTPSHDSDSRWLAIPFLVTLSFTTPCRFIPTLSARRGCSLGGNGADPKDLRVGSNGDAAKG